MGAESLKAAVVDAGPLIHLSEIGCVQHLQIFKTIHIPNAVWSETIEQARFWNLEEEKGSRGRKGVKSAFDP